MADSDFIPTRGGGEREHLGFVRVARRTDRIAALVIPTDIRSFDPTVYRSEIGDAPLLPIARRKGLWRLLHPRYPFVVASRPLPKALADRLRELAPDATGVLTLSYKSRLIGLGLAQRLDLPMVVRYQNREGDYHRDLAVGSRGLRRWVMAWEGWRVTRDERAFDRSPHVTAVADISADDARARTLEGARRVVHVPPFTIDIDREPLRRSAQGGRRVLFLGALDVVTNQEALRWFVDRVWPTVRAQVPAATFDVVGSRPSAEVRELVAAVPGVDLHADVPDIAPFLARADVAVNPAVIGSGVNIKLVDYLQAGTPVVSTTLATRGLPLRPGRDLRVEDDADDFARAVIALLTDPAGAERMAVDGRERLLTVLDPVRNLERIEAAFEGRPGPPIDA